MNELRFSVKRAVGVVSDLHGGSKFAPFPPNIYDKEGGNISASRNSGQIQLYESLLKFRGALDRCNVDTLVTLGDMCSGVNKMESGRHQITPDLDYQMKAVIEMLKPMVKGRIHHCFSGSLYHESLDSRIHEQIFEQLQPYSGQPLSRFHDAVANIALEGTNITMNVIHGVSAAAIYRTTLMDREGFHQLASQALDKLPKADIILRGHWHQYINIDIYGQNLVQAPCWQAWSPWRGNLRLYGKTQPDIGGLIIFVLDDDGEETIYVRKFQYPCPHIEDMLVQG